MSALNPELAFVPAFDAMKAIDESGLLISPDDVYAISPLDYGTDQAVRLTSGLEIVVRKMRVSPQWPRGLGETGWLASFLDTESDREAPFSFDSPLFLKGLLEQRERRIKGTDRQVYEVSLYTGPYWFNSVMERLGHVPGWDCFKMVAKLGGKFDPVEYLESVSRKEIPVADTNARYFMHDRELRDHVGVWWSTPTDNVTSIQRKAQEVLRTGDPLLIEKFTEGLDRLAEFPRDIVEFTGKLLDGEPDVTVNAKIEQMETFLDAYSIPLTHRPVSSLRDTEFRAYIRRRESLKALINMGFSPNYSHVDPDVSNLIKQQAPLTAERAILTNWATAYVLNMVDIWPRLDSIVGAPEGVNLSKRRELFVQLKRVLNERLHSQIVAA